MTKKWELVEIENTMQDEATNKLQARIANTKYDLQENGKVIVQSRTEKRGRWQLINNNTHLQILLDDYDGGHVWQIINLNKNRLKLKKKGSNNVYVFDAN